MESDVRVSIDVAVDAKGMRELVARFEVIEASFPLPDAYVEVTKSMAAELKRLAEVFGALEEAANQALLAGFGEHQPMGAVDDCPCPLCVARRESEATTGELCECAACIRRRIVMAEYAAAAKRGAH